MSLLKKQVRKNIVKILKQAKTFAGQNVRSSRSEKNWVENLPGINLYFRGDVTEELDQAPRRLKRNWPMEVELIAKGPDGEILNDIMDDFAEQIEQCLSVDDSIGDCANDIVLLGTSDVETDSSGTEVVGKISLNYRIELYEFFPRDRKGQGSFDDFTINAKWDLDGEQDFADQAEDDLTPTP